MSASGLSGPRRIALGMAILAGLSLSGCAAPVIGGLTAAEIFSIAGLGAAVMTGRDLTEHAVSAVTGQDCRFLETLLRGDRSFCEPPDSVATRNDFRGVIALLDEGKGEPDKDTKLAATDLDPDLLGFAPIDRHAAGGFSLEMTSRSPGKDSRPSSAMRPAVSGRPWHDDLAIHDRKPETRLADAAPIPVGPLGLRPSHAEYLGL